MNDQPDRCPDCGADTIDGVACACTTRRGPEASFPDDLDRLAEGIEAPHTARGEPTPEVAGALYDAADEIRRLRAIPPAGVSRGALPYDQMARDAGRVLAAMEGGELTASMSEAGDLACHVLAPLEERDRLVRDCRTYLEDVAGFVKECQRLRQALATLDEGDPGRELRRIAFNLRRLEPDQSSYANTLCRVAFDIDKATEAIRGG